jgi:hypothetical protein
MEIYIHEKFADGITDIARSFGIEAGIIGQCQSADTKSLLIHHQGKDYHY